MADIARADIARADLDALLDRVGATRNRDLLVDILRTALGLAGDDADRLDLKITASALREMRSAYTAFAPYRELRKVTIFGSARTHPDDPLYDQARRAAAELAARQWMVVTGAGPGIMAAGMEGAGREWSFGVTIRLPFEERANAVIEGDQKLVAMKYFFTRKLMLMKESAAFIALPGGFGTQDETFELFTLQQTGKAQPAPVVLLDVPGATYWSEWDRFVRDELLASGLISPEDVCLYTVTSDVEEACREITDFYRNYVSIRWSGDKLILRVLEGPTDEQLEALNDHHGGLLVEGRFERSGPLHAERSSGDVLHLPRVVGSVDLRRQSGLRALIGEINSWVDDPTA